MRISEALFNGSWPKLSTHDLEKCFENPDFIFCSAFQNQPHPTHRRVDKHAVEHTIHRRVVVCGPELFVHIVGLAWILPRCDQGLDVVQLRPQLHAGVFGRYNGQTSADRVRWQHPATTTSVAHRRLERTIATAGQLVVCGPERVVRVVGRAGLLPRCDQGLDVDQLCPQLHAGVLGAYFGRCGDQTTAVHGRHLVVFVGFERHPATPTGHIHRVHSE